MSTQPEEKDESTDRGGNAHSVRPEADKMAAGDDVIETERVKTRKEEEELMVSDH